MSSKFTRRGALTGAAAFAGASVVALGVSAEDAPETHTITITSFAFVPDRIVVWPGDTVRWTNLDLVPHTATGQIHGWDTGEIGRGESRDIVVKDGMESAYFCVFHPHMKATIVLASQ